MNRTPRQPPKPQPARRSWIAHAAFTSAGTIGHRQQFGKMQTNMTKKEKITTDCFTEIKRLNQKVKEQGQQLVYAKTTNESLAAKLNEITYRRRDSITADLSAPAKGKCEGAPSTNAPHLTRIKVG